jgi:hypothetical protein
MIWRVFAAFFRREIRAAALGRFIHVFWVLALLAGLLPVGEDDDGGGALALLPFCIYFLPLFALLAGVGSAQNETEEREILLAQPLGAVPRALGKFLALWLVAGSAALPLVLPLAVRGGDLRELGFLGAHAAAVSGIFAALGLAVGFSTADRTRAYLGGLCLWLVLLAGFDLIALAAARNGFAEESPRLWISLLMASPLDALRIGSLLRLGQIPFDTATVPPVGRWWLGHPITWFAALSFCWIASALGWAAWRLERRRN